MSMPQIYFLFIGIFIVCIVLLEVIFFSSAPIEVDESKYQRQDSISVILSSQQESNQQNQRKLNIYDNSDNDEKHINNNKNMHKYYDVLYDANKDWFNATRWHSHSQINFSCPVYENICVYNQHFYVHNKSDEFDLDWKKPMDLLGADMPNWKETGPIYKKFFHSTMWNKDEYLNTKCYYNSIYNHLILEANYQTMLGEFYSRTLRFLHYLHNIQSLITNDIQLWLLIGDQKSLFVSHYLFTERFSKYNLLHFSAMFDHISCQCYHRIMFCGFQRKGHEIIWPRKYKMRHKNYNKSVLLQQQYINYNHTYLLPLKSLIDRMEPEEARNIYSDMIIKYNQWIDAMDMNLNDDIRKWKYQQLLENGIDIQMNEIDEWRFIGLYDRKIRRSWLNIMKHKRNCNDKYNKYKIFCHIIILEDFLHSRDVIIIHRASFMLIGVHGAQLTDAIWMSYDKNKNNTLNKYIIELLPYGGPKYTSSIEKPTALGIIFWNSHYNHVGLKLLNTSIQSSYKIKWAQTDFSVQWQRLTLIIDFLIIDDGGMCTKYGRADKLNISKEIMDLGFAVYNAYCVENPLIWHGTKTPRIY